MKTTTKFLLALALFFSLFNGCSEEELFFEEEKTQEEKIIESTTKRLPAASNFSTSSARIIPTEICNCFSLIVKYKEGTSEAQKVLYRNNWADCVGLINYTPLDNQREVWILDYTIYNNSSALCPIPVESGGGKDLTLTDDPIIDGIEQDTETTINP
ncbi:hypothetical protein [Lacinutrix sp. Hel_I_90]|uniref:hypothetical protein n=1 Tax=Lacinutrix sp. Hel_I_90 TaxID=1249999 RepID=UPI0005C80FAE|nr:hypothetical protein [Lacinutrix sp. Hel_I_90]